MSHELEFARTMDACKRLRLVAIANELPTLLDEAARQELGYLTFLDRVLQREVETKSEKRVRMGIQIAHFPAVKTLDDFDYAAQPSVNPKVIRELASGRFVASAQNVMFFGPPGVGKSHLAIGLGRAAVSAGYSVLFVTAVELLTALERAREDGKLEARLAHYTKPKLLIIDELGYLPLERSAAHLLFQLVVRRYERTSTIVTTNQSIAQWGTMLGDDMTAAAILDRLLHHAHTLVIQGDSYRMRQKRKAGLLGAPARATGSGELGRATSSP